MARGRPTFLRFTSWTEVKDFLRQQPTGTMLRLPRSLLPHPEDARAQRTFSFPMGQRDDFRWSTADDWDMFAQDTGAHYEVRVEKRELRTKHLLELQPTEQLETETAGSAAIGGAALGALLGGLIGGSKAATLVGAGLGALVGAVLGSESEGAALDSNPPKRMKTL